MTKDEAMKLANSKNTEVKTQKPMAWPEASKEDKKLGWKLSYRFLEELSNTAEGRPSLETVESVLLLATRSIQ